MQLDHPYWIDDPDFDLDFHIRHLSLAPPGRVDQLAEQISRIVGRPMDRSRPLWEVYVIEGLESGRWALLTKYHHATIDGASGVMMLMLIHDLTPDAPPLEESPAWQADPMPSDLELVRLALGNLARNPAKAVRAQLRLARDLAESAGITSISTAARQAGAAVKAIATRMSPGNDDGERLSLPNTAAPPTPWNKSITAHRRFAMRSASLSNIKRLKDVTGGTVNDVVMAIVAGALREYLLMHDALPDRPLRAMVPVSIRTGDEDDTWTNRVSGLVADLPTDTPDPIERVGALQAGDGCRQAPVRARASRRTRRHHAVRLAGGCDVRHPAGLAAAARRPRAVAGERDRVERARPAAAALLQRGATRAVHPRLDGRRGHGPEHHRAQLPRRADVRADLLP